LRCCCLPTVGSTLADANQSCDWRIYADWPLVRERKSHFLFRCLGLALFSGVFEVGGLVIGSNDYDLPALMLKLAHITIAEFGTPFESWRVIPFHVIKRPMGMRSGHILAELVNMATDDDAGLTLRHWCIEFGSLRVATGRER
jgi:hypothetical protein